MNRIYQLSFACAVIVCAACKPSSGPGEGSNAPIAPRADSAAQPPRTAENDDRIEASFKKTHIYATYLKDDNIAIDAKDGIVALTGTVGDLDRKMMAEHTAEALPGVASVENRIEVTGDAVAEASDAWIGSKVKAELLRHRNVSTGRTQVEVKDGVVILRGEASNAAQRELTAEYAKDVQGVKDVVNEITLPAAADKPAQSVGDIIADAGDLIDDASISAQIKMSLLTHRSTSALKTKVSTKDGVVALSGRAKNAAERDLVTKIVSDINGVKSVVNNMTLGND